MRRPVRLLALTQASSRLSPCSLPSTAKNLRELLRTVYVFKTLRVCQRQNWGIPRLTLSAYLTFWAIICYLVTVWLLFFKSEVSTSYCPTSYPNDRSYSQDPPSEEDDDMNLKRVYGILWSVCKLKRTHYFRIPDNNSFQPRPP